MPTKAKTLFQLLKGRQELVFSGVEKGGSIRIVKEIPVDLDKPCFDVSPNLYDQDYVVPFFITIFPDFNRGENFYYYQLDEYYKPEGKDPNWYRRFGTGFLINDNQLNINEADGINGQISYDNNNNKNKLRLYRERSYSDRSNEFTQASVLNESSTQERNKYTGCNDYITIKRVLID